MSHAHRAPDGMMLRRSAFEFLQKKSVIPSVRVFAPTDAAVEIITSSDGVKRIAFSLSSEVSAGVILVSPCAVICFDTDYNVISYGRGQSQITCREPLDIAGRRDALAYPVDRYYDNIYKDTAPQPKKRKQEMLPDHFPMLPETALVHIASYAATMQNIIPLTTRVCKHWTRVLNESTEGDEILWKGVCLKYYPVLEQIKGAITTAGDENTSRWKGLFYHRARHLKALFAPGKEAVDRHDRSIGPFEPAPLEKLLSSVTLDVWKDDQESAIRVPQVQPKKVSDSSIHLELPSAVASGCTALVIYVHRWEGSAPALLFSGKIGSSGFSFTNAFNQFDKFRSRSYFVGVRPEEESRTTGLYPTACDPVGIPAVIPVLVGSNHPPGSDLVTLEVHFAWQTNLQFQDWPTMSLRDTRVFLQKGLTPVPDGSLPPLPTSQNDIVSKNWALSKHSPRPLASYGFLVDYLLHADEAEPCARDITSRFYEAVDVFQLLRVRDNPNLKTLPSPILKFNVTPECLGMLKSRPLVWVGESAITVEAIVYVVDKGTGIQVKLFQGKPRIKRLPQGCYGLDEFGRYDEFAVASFFDGIPDNFGGSAPLCEGQLSWDGASADLMIRLRFINRSSGRCWYFLEVEYLTLFDKGLPWGTYAPGFRRQ